MRPGGRGRLPAPGSHRSERAQLRHSAPRTMASLRWRAPASRRFGRLPASCRACVETACGPMSMPSVRPAAHDPVRRFPPPGPVGQVPRLQRYYQRTPTSRRPSRRASSPSLGGTTGSPCSLPQGRALPRGRDALVWRQSACRVSGGDGETSQVPGRPIACMPRSPTPVEPAAPGQSRRPRRGLPHPSRRRLPRSRLFRGSITRPARLPVYASQPGSPPDHATLGSGWLANLGRSGLPPAGSHRRFPSCHCMASSFTKLCLAQDGDVRAPARASAGPRLGQPVFLIQSWHHRKVALVVRHKRAAGTERVRGDHGIVVPDWCASRKQRSLDACELVGLRLAPGEHTTEPVTKSFDHSDMAASAARTQRPSSACERRLTPLVAIATIQRKRGRTT